MRRQELATAILSAGESQAVDRFRRDLDALAAPEATLGLAVSGGPDSLALLLLAAESRPLRVEAATVDHALRPESRAEAETVARLCERLGVPHRILTASWPEKPQSAIQEQARTVRYRLLCDWARERSLAALLTAHHLDDQAETVLMRLARGAGVNGLAGIRRAACPPSGIPLLRPLLGWRHSELVAICSAAGVEAIEDPSNEDDRFERVRVRKALAQADWLDPLALARSAAHLAQAEAALQWATSLEWQRAVRQGNEQSVYRPTDAPLEIRRRIVRRLIRALATEGGSAELRGRELDQVIAALTASRNATLRGVLCIGGSDWRFARAPRRKS